MEYTIAELHLHTAESSWCGKMSAVDAIPLFKENGYDLVCVTDHFNYEYFQDYYKYGKWKACVHRWYAGWYTAKEAGEKCGVTVLHGAEFRFRESFADYIVYGMTDELYHDHPEMLDMTSAEFSVFAREHGLYFSQAHPFRNDFQCDPKYLDGIEIYNFHPTEDSDNHLAVEVAKKNPHLIPTCGQDFHFAEAMQGAKTRFFGKVSDMPTLIAKLRGREYEMILPDGRIVDPKNPQ